MSLRPGITCEPIAPGSMEVLIECLLLIIHRKHTEINHIVTHTFPHVELDWIACWRLRCQKLKDGRLGDVTEFEDFAIICEASTIRWHLCYEHSLHVQVNVVFILEDFTAIGTLPLPSFASSFVLLMPPIEIVERVEGALVWPRQRTVATLSLTHVYIETVPHDS